MVESCGAPLPSQPRLIWREKIRSEGGKNGHGWDKSFPCSDFFESTWLPCHGFMLGQTGVFFLAYNGVDYLPSVVLLNEDYRNYVRGFFLNNKYQYNASAYH
jgi:hypothetical protein